MSIRQIRFACFLAIAGAALIGYTHRVDGTIIGFAAFALWAVAEWIEREG